MDIKMLDIDQCPDEYHVPNTFKDTHKCDDKSSYVSTTKGLSVSALHLSCLFCWYFVGAPTSGVET